MLSPLYRRVKVYRQDQIDIALLCILDKQRRFRVHEIQIHFLVIDHAERVDEKLRIESDQKVFSFLDAHNLQSVI